MVRGFSLWLSLMLMFFSMVPCYGEAQWTEETLSHVIQQLLNEEIEELPAHQRVIPSRRQWDEARGLDPDWMHVLLLSTGSADIRENFGKADVSVIFSIHMETGEFHLISLPWRGRIAAAGLPAPIPLNCVNCFGGPALMMQSLNRALSMNISRYCAVNEEAFYQVVDALGGVQLALRQEERQALGIQEECPLLDAETALEFVQLPLEGEDRALRLIAAAYDQLMEDGTLEQAFDLADRLLPCIDSNLTTAELLDLLFLAFMSDEPLDFTPHELPLDEENRLDAAAGEELRAMIYGGE